MVVRALLVSLALAALLSPTSMAAAEDSQPEVAYRVIFTTGLDEDNNPVDNLEEIPITSVRIYFYVMLFNLEDGQEYGYECRMYDGQGDLLQAHRGRFTAENGGWNFWCFTRPDTRVDRPGTWRSEGFLNGELLVEAELRVPAS